jgi:hypothetical protein
VVPAERHIYIGRHEICIETAWAVSVCFETLARGGRAVHLAMTLAGAPGNGRNCSCFLLSGARMVVISCALVACEIRNKSGGSTLPRILRILDWRRYNATPLRKWSLREELCSPIFSQKCACINTQADVSKERGEHRDVFSLTVLADDVIKRSDGDRGLSHRREVNLVKSINSEDPDHLYIRRRFVA